MKSSSHTIILAAGPINYTNLPIGTNQSNAMIPIHGKPVIGWILDDLIQKQVLEAVVVLRKENHHLAKFLRQTYAKRLKLKLVEIQKSESILDSLNQGLESFKGQKRVRIILGDTLIRDSYEAKEDFVYTGSVSDAARWCIAKLDPQGNIRDLRDKQKLPNSREHIALAGYYFLTDGLYLKKCLNESLKKKENELSAVLKRYMRRYPLKTRKAKDWFDFGHIDHVLDAKRRLLPARSFNRLVIDPVLNTITKESENNLKLQDELEWYQALPSRLQVLTPRILDSQNQNGKLKIVQEYYGYPTLAEIYVFGDLDSDAWDSMLKRVLHIHQEFLKYPGRLKPEDMEAIYVTKTWKRLEALKRQDPYWEKLLLQEIIDYNGQKLLNVFRLQPKLNERAKKLAKSAKSTILHGDFCFSNILFDMNNQIIRLIDPRGRFGPKGIYGDPRYDMAKLRHSISGLYDFFIADLFALQEMDQKFKLKIFTGELQRQLQSQFDHLLHEMGYNLEEIKFLEGLLFISMTPLHHGHAERQKAMYLTGLQLLNEILIP